MENYLNVVFVEVQRDAVGSSNHFSVYETSIFLPKHIINDSEDVPVFGTTCCLSIPWTLITTSCPFLPNSLLLAFVQTKSTRE